MVVTDLNRRISEKSQQHCFDFMTGKPISDTTKKNQDYCWQEYNGAQENLSSFDLSKLTLKLVERQSDPAETTIETLLDLRAERGERYLTQKGKLKVPHDGFNNSSGHRGSIFSNANTVSTCAQSNLDKNAMFDMLLPTKEGTQLSNSQSLFHRPSI